MAVALQSSASNNTTLNTRHYYNNLETYSLLWLGASVNSQENIDAQQKLRSSINHLESFKQSDQCEKYIRSLSSPDRIILIVRDRLGQKLVPRIHQLRQIFSIHVYGIRKQKNQC
ncbi:unnamed protein product [Rotaria socialis]|uniref:Uncharacterized protein n=1 Tax=Rotaria socialis TaxID=392032 RepID=A0A820Y4H1_9BILA|nr:unnamed protein product [Rotaria socialis]CAF3401889.1 unnamed protein product [Rotaria socialis]CAF3605468.1 unnamed protein product [Rotaria socialis]CAF3666170.1 unnamed protein product [Rotaria socialis]CAF4514906.1 unnamed protein product [Rotaria socialis]